MTFVGLALIAIGTGGIKPCVSAFGGDQFQLPEQERQLQTFFSVFYFSINAGSFISTIVTPILREDVHCFGDKTCYSLAFGVPAALMAVATVIIIMGKPLYKMNPPQGNIVFKVVASILSAVSRNARGERGASHWMDVVKADYGQELVEDVKCLLRVLVLYLPVPIWWALFDQTGSRWTFQATRMNGSLGGAGTLKPDQIQVLNPILILILLPTFDKLFYPLCAKFNFLKKPLQRMCLGGILCAVSFVVSGVLELQLQKTYARLPAANTSSLHLMNSLPCPVAVKLLGAGDLVLDQTIADRSSYIAHDLPAAAAYSLQMSVEAACLPAQLTTRTAEAALQLTSEQVAAVVLGASGAAVAPVVLPDPEDPRKDNDANAKVRVTYDLGPGTAVTNFSLLGEDRSHQFLLNETSVSSTEYSAMEIGEYR